MTNYERYFGTPQKAAKVAAAFCRAADHCYNCPFGDLGTCPSGDSEHAYIEWLESEAE